MAFVDNAIDVDADVRDAYDLWTVFEEYPEFMQSVERVDIVEDDQLHWVAVVEDDTLEWDADIVEHTPEERITWHAVDGRETGQVRFEKLGGDHTRVRMQLEYDPAAWEGDPEAVSQWMEQRVQSDLESFKGLLEGIEASTAT